MRFVLDENVDARCCRLLNERGHECWSVPAAGLAGEADSNLTVYADDRNAALITHDLAFSKKVQKNIIGWHIRLDCHNVDAVDVLGRHLDDVVGLIERHRDLYVTLSPLRLQIHHRSESWD